MSLLTVIENAFVTTEADVKGLILKAKTGVEIDVQHLAAARKWIVGNAPTIAADVQEVLSIVTLFGDASNPQVATAIRDVNLATNALNAFAATSNAGQNTVQSLEAGYVAVKQAQAAVASATAVSISTAPAPVTPSAPAPAPAAA